jgi:uncharacterized protein YbjT (DUF2867 family)
MRILLFGSTGMIGQGVLREALRDDDFSDYAAVEERLRATTPVCSASASPPLA